jgi:hypothetical protein
MVILFAIQIVLVMLSAFFIFLYIRAKIYKKEFEYMWLDKIKISEVYDDLKIGDIFLFVNSTHGFYESLILRSWFNHTAVLVKKNGDHMEMVEMTFGSKPHKNGKRCYDVNFIPVLTRAKHYNGRVFLMRLNKPLDDERMERTISFAENNKCIKFPTMGIMAKEFIFGRSDTYKHCFGYVWKLLEYINLLPHGSEYGVFNCARKITKLHEKQLPDGYRYEEIKELVYDI